MTQGERLADAALALVGVPFRLHGRDPATGLDCVGLVVAAMQATGRRPDVPAGYSMANLSVSAWLPMAAASGWMETSGEPMAGDLLFAVPGPARAHLLLATGTGAFVHAHAGLRRVVHTPPPLPWPIRRQWRLADL